MKKYLILFAILCIPVSVWAWGVLGMSGGSGDGGAAPEDYTDDVISYWMMEQATGATATDGNSANDLTASSDGGGPTQVAESIQGTYSSDYVPAYYEYYERTDTNLSAGFPGKDSGGSTGSFTIGCWVKPDAALNELFGKNVDSNETSYGLYIDASANVVFAVSNQGWQANASITGSTTLTVDGTEWYHIVGVFDDSADLIYLYVDGSSDATAVAFSSTIWLGTSQFTIGQSNYAGFFDGHFDECFIADSAFSSSDISSIHDNGLAGER